MPYQVELSSAALRDLKRIRGSVRPRLRRAMKALGNDPRPHGTVKLTPVGEGYRIRVGSYRILYRVDDQLRKVIIGRILRRSEATYRRR